MTNKTEQKPAGEQLAEWLKAEKVKQVDFADIIDMHHVSLSRIINGHRTISGKTARKIEAATCGAVKVQSWF